MKMAKKNNNPKQAPCNNCSKTTCKKENKSAQNSIERLLLVGNSPNLVDGQNRSCEWGRLLEDLEKKIKPYVKEIEKGGNFPRRMEIIRQYAKKPGFEEVNQALNTWYKRISDMLPSSVHRMLGAMSRYFQYCLTTNYDYTIEKVFKIQKKRSKGGKKANVAINPPGKNGSPSVTHIHGVANDPESIIMSKKEYEEGLKLLRNASESWVDCFKSCEIHICGMTMGKEEKLLWYALDERKKFLEEQKYLAHKRPHGYAYLFENKRKEGEGNKIKRLKTALLEAAIVPIVIPVENDDYFTAWKTLIGEMILNIIGANSQNDFENLPEKILRKLELGGGRIASRNTNMSTAFATCYKDPKLCQLTLSKRKRQVIEESGNWLIYCRVFEKRHFYKLNWETIQNSYPESEAAWNFFLDYGRGILYKVTESGVSLEKVAQVERGMGIDAFCRKVQSSVKKKTR